MDMDLVKIRFYLALGWVETGSVASLKYQNIFTLLLFIALSEFILFELIFKFK